MTDYFIMGGILLFLLLALVTKANFLPEGNNEFFNLDNSNAMRGLWSLIVILVHIPAAYQNKIQDILGSFAYIGVTFFFMTSAYGLSLSEKKKPDCIKRFWKSRLPKLIIPNLIINFFIYIVYSLCFEQDINIVNILNVNIWVRWLLACYFAFWLGYYLIKDARLRSIIVCCLVFMLSFICYWLRTEGVITTSTWCSEVIGFIWGILLFMNIQKFKDFSIKKWKLNIILSCLTALLLGFLYLKFKHIIFVGDFVLKIVLGLAILTFMLLLNIKISIGNKITYFLGDISYEIYLTHGFVFKLIILLNDNLTSGVFILVSFVITVGLSTLIHCLCRKIYSLI